MGGIDGWIGGYGLRSIGRLHYCVARDARISLLVSPNPSQVLKIKVGCTTAVLKLPGNNVKEMEIVLQGHCVNEVVDYLREAYCVDRQWIDLGKELDRKGKKILPTSL